MEIQDILLPETKIYIGYQLTALVVTKWTEKDIEDIWSISVKELTRIPAKIGRFLDKTKIKRAWKTDCEKDIRDNWYFILTTDNTMFEAHY